MKYLPSFFLVLFVFVVPAYAQTAADSTAIRRQAERWVEAARQEDADALAALYTEDAIMLPPGAPPITGRDRIRSLFARQFARSEGTYEFQTYELVVTGDWAYRRGSYVATVDPAQGDAVRLEDKFIDIWRRSPDGEWRIARDIWNHTAPPSPVGKDANSSGGPDRE